MRSYSHILAIAALVISPITATHASGHGDELYQQHCSACHGAAGNGGVGVPLALGDFQASVSDEYLKKSIQLGRPGRVMPAFTQLTDKEVASIVKHIRSFANVPYPKEDRTPIKGDPKQGEKVYAQHCAACHGAQGQGGEGTGVTFSRPRNQPIIAPALNNPGFLAAASDQMIKHTLIKGRKGTPMISFLENGLSEQDLDNVVSYIRTYEKLAPKKEPVAIDEEPTIVYDSPFGVEKTIEMLKRAILGKNFKMIRVQTFDDGFVPKDKEKSSKSIVYFCNFGFLNRALGIDPRVGMFLPCRITVIEKEGKVQVMAINPMHLSRLFNNSELDKACIEMRNIYEEILEEATI